LSHLLKLCSEFFASLDMPLDISKSKCSRFGLRYKKECPDIILELGTLKWASSFMYLRISVVAGKKIICDYSGPRRKFFPFFNTIYGRVGSKDSTILLLTLLSSVCTPALLLGVEVALGNDK